MEPTEMRPNSCRNEQGTAKVADEAPATLRGLLATDNGIDAPRPSSILTETSQLREHDQLGGIYTMSIAHCLIGSFPGKQRATPRKFHVSFQIKDYSELVSKALKSKTV